MVCLRVKVFKDAGLIVNNVGSDPSAHQRVCCCLVASEWIGVGLNPATAGLYS